MIKYGREEGWKLTNLSLGGKKNFKHSESTKQRLREINIGKPGPFSGKHHREDSKQLMSKSKIGNKFCVGYIHSIETNIKNSKSKLGNKYNYGKKWTDEARKRQSERQRGKPGNNLGKHHTEEWKLEHSRKMKGHIPWNKGLKIKIDYL